MITTNFNNGTLEVYKNGQCIISQPFKPTSTGQQPNWENEAEALEWWNSIKEPYEYEPPPIELTKESSTPSTEGAQ